MPLAAPVTAAADPLIAVIEAFAPKDKKAGKTARIPHLSQIGTEP